MKINNKKITISTTIIVSFLLFLFVTPNLTFAQKSNDTDVEKKEVIKKVEEDSNIEQPPDLDDYDPPPATVDESGKIESPFEVNITIGTQSPWNGKVPLLVEITPLIDSSRTEIRWDSGYGITFEPKYDNFFPLAKGETKTYKALVDPGKSGVYSITASVTDWGYGRNYISSDQISLTFDDNLITDPKTDGYTMAILMRYVALILIFVLVIGIGIFFGRYLLAWLKEWLRPPEY